VSEADAANLANLARDMRAILLEIREVTRYMKDAESEIPEKARRFIMYYHDVHDIVWLYHENGQEPPDYLRKELERCSDRYRHIVEDLFGEDGTFERVRQEMTKRGGNRYDHSRILPKQEVVNETGNGK
jgi:hypothetical protein